MQYVRDILLKKPEDRTDYEIRDVMPLLRGIKFFKDQNIDTTDLTDVVQGLTYDFFPRGKEVFEYGSIGEKFYMILEGEVSVMVPNQECRDFRRRFEELTEERKW